MVTITTHGSYSHQFLLIPKQILGNGPANANCQPTQGIKLCGHHCSLSFLFVNTKPMWWKQNRPYMEEQTDAQRKTGTRGGRPQVIKKLNIFMNLCQNEKTQRWVE